MLRLVSTLTTIGLCFCWPVLTLAQDEITAMSFGEVPGGITFSAGGVSPIRLLGDTVVIGGVTASGEIESASGFRFPDGTVQTTALEDTRVCGANVGLTANAGLYNNRIADVTPPLSFTEICFKNGTLSSDLHSGGESTEGGDCQPGDVGWIFERLERNSGAVSSWVDARADCLQDGMRLPEPFEWQLMCSIAELVGIESLTDDWEWASNSVKSGNIPSTGVAFVVAMVYGNGSCNHAAEGILGANNGTKSDFSYRCVR